MGLARMMGSGLKGILRLQWLAYWRRSNKNSLVILGLIALGAMARYASILRTVTAQVRKGQFGELDLLAAAVFAVCVSPLWTSGNAGIGPRELARFPLTAPERLVAQIWGGFVSPIAWAAALFCCSLFWPLASSPHPVCAVVAGLSLLGGLFMAGVSARHFLETAQGRNIGRIALGAVLLAAAVLWTRMGRGAAVAFRAFPSHLVVLAAGGSWIACGALIALAVAACMIARYSIIWMLERQPTAESRTTSSSTKMTLLGKDLRYFRGSETVSWFILFGLLFYLATASAPEPDAVRATLAFTSILGAAAAMNSFGQDGADGLHRYGLWPLTGFRILSTKNRALAVLAAARWLPPIALSAWRFGWREGLYDGVEACALLLGSMAWGNVASVRHPYIGEEASSILDQIVGLAASALPGAITIAMLRGPAERVPYAMFGMLGVCIMLYLAGLRWASNYYARAFDAMHERLSQ